MRTRRILLPTLAALSLGGLVACSPISERRGYIPDAQTVSQIEIGLDDKDSVRQLLGSPTTMASFTTTEGDAWYYVSTLTERIAFLPPKAVERSIVGVYFDPNRTVTDIRRYGLEDAQIVDYETRKTPTSGKELSVLAQLFGNIGRYNPGGGGQAGPDGGAPTPGGRIPR